jgi:propionyl-CoA carboxylase beta chain
MTHNSVSGVGHFIARDDAECVQMIRELLSYLPQNNREDPPRRPCDRSDRPRRPRARHHRSRRIESPLRHQRRDSPRVDDGWFFEVHEHFARNIVVGFARLDGRPSASSPISRRFSPAASTSTHR